LAGSFGNCRLEGGVEFRSGKKPEALLELILRHFSSPGDLVLDSFLGSDTTAAVAHKMGRRYIGIELGEHCYTHC
jgi:adenine-specific DNA-methyltransferase